MVDEHNSVKAFKPSPTRRNYILQNGILDEYCSARLKDFREGYQSPDPKGWNFLNALGPNLNDFIGKHGLEVYYDCRLLYQSRKKRSSKCRGKIEDMTALGQCYFVTLTFTDEALSRSTLERRRVWVSRWFKKQCDKYCANIDFGSKNGREHYHGIILCNEKPSLEWKHGFIKIIPIGNSETDYTRLGKYITKLTAHSLKASTGNAYRVIYSRKMKKILFGNDE